MRKTSLVWAGSALLLAAAGLAYSPDFLAHYHSLVRQSAAENSGALVEPVEVAAAPVDYFSLIVEPRDAIAPILSRIEGAKHSIDLVMYKLDDAQVEAALKAAQARGVSVRVLLNGGYYGTHEKANDAVYARLSNAGILVKWTPTYFALTHQKTLVVDGQDALIMTMNLQQKYYATGRDFALDDTDPRDVAAIEQAFADDWQGREALASSGDDLLWSPGAENETLYLINSATSTLKIYNEEMADKDVIDALKAAAARGVRVQVDMTYATNWKSAFNELSNAGVLVRTWASTGKPLYVHAKVIVADGREAFVGSQNFSETSLSKNRELGILLHSPAVIEELNAVFDADWERARPFVAAK